MSEEIVVSFKNVTKKFGKAQILNGITLDIYKNKITTILGFSGAGKSTLLKHILGLLQPTSGTVTILGQDLSQLDQFAIREFRRKFGMVFQYAALFDSFDAFENVAFPLKEFTDYNDEKIKTIVYDLLEAVNLQKDSFHRLPSELSGGMRKRVGLARALALSPEIMLYDEPTTGLDPITTKMVNELIADTAIRHKERGLTSIIISHDVKATLKISDYVAFVERGNLVEYLPVEEFIKSKNPAIRQFLEL